jgi:branched-chain amino acid transport system permease protein
VYAALLASGFVLFAGIGALIEMTYHLQLNAAITPDTRFLGVPLDTGSAGSWIAAVAVMLVGLAMFEPVRRRFAARWSQAQTEIEHQVQQAQLAQVAQLSAEHAAADAQAGQGGPGLQREGAR